MGIEPRPSTYSLRLFRLLANIFLCKGVITLSKKKKIIMRKAKNRPLQKIEKNGEKNKMKLMEKDGK